MKYIQSMDFFPPQKSDLAVLRLVKLVCLCLGTGLRLENDCFLAIEKHLTSHI